LYAEIFSKANFPDALLALDRELALEVKQRGCPRCGATLDFANYARKPRGGPFALDNAQSRRLSLCCRREGCRLRVTPPSVRFLGRRVYLSVVVLLCGVLRQGPSAWRADVLRRVVGADRRTLERWRCWWVERIGRSRNFEIGRATSCRRPKLHRCRSRCSTTSSARPVSVCCARCAGWRSSLGHDFRRMVVVTQNLLAELARRRS
jgi:hypothetical protein